MTHTGDTSDVMGLCEIHPPEIMVFRLMIVGIVLLSGYHGFMIVYRIYIDLHRFTWIYIYLHLYTCIFTCIYMGKNQHPHGIDLGVSEFPISMDPRGLEADPP